MSHARASMAGMGKRNRERRRAKHRRGKSSPEAGPGDGGSAGHHAGSAPSSPHGSSKHPRAGAEEVEALLRAAAVAFGNDQDARYAELLTRLGIGAGTAGGGDAPAGTAQVLGVLLDRQIGDAWRRGWQPADVERVVRRRLGAGHAGAVAAVIADEHRRYSAARVSPAWRAQLRAIGANPWDGDGSAGGAGAGEVRRRVEVLSLLLALGALPRLGPLPGEATAGPSGAGTDVDDRVLERVRALLAKAESTTFAEEAEAFTAKAQELMARHALDRAMLDGAGQAAGPGGRRIGTDDPYAQSKALLLDEVATANRCRTVWSPSLGFSTVFGHEADIDGVELLYTSLLVQAARAVAAAGPQIDRRGRSTTRSFRKSFYVAYATRIGQRLRESTAAAEAAGAEAHGAALLPVLAARDQAVEDAFREAFPTTERYRVSATNGAGWVAGTTAADQARLDPSPEVPRRASA
jgi:hypothetical protein